MNTIYYKNAYIVHFRNILAHLVYLWIIYTYVKTFFSCWAKFNEEMPQHCERHEK